jgi:hypothetical protein
MRHFHPLPPVPFPLHLRYTASHCKVERIDENGVITMAEVHKSGGVQLDRKKEADPVITVGDQSVPLIEYIENGIRANLTQGHCVLITEQEFDSVLNQVNEIIA